MIRYQAAGADAIGLWLPKLLEYGEERAVELLAVNDLPVSSLSWGGSFTGAFGCELADVLVETRQLIRLAGTLGAKSLVLVTGPKNRHLNKHANRLLVESLCELADDAASHGVVLALQPMLPQFAETWTFLHTLDQALKVLEQVDHRFVKLAFDVYHLGHEPNLTARLPDLLPWLDVVQVSDRRMGTVSEYERLLPGQGTLPVKDILSSLMDAGYRGYVDYQIWNHDCWRCTDSTWLQRCRDNFLQMCPVECDSVSL